MSITNPFGPDTPNTPDSERIDSALDNFIKQFFGIVTKSTDVDGNVVWTLPEPLDELEPVPGTKRVDGEGLAQYLARVLTEGVNAVAGKNGYATTVRSYHNQTQPAVGDGIAFDVDDASLFSAGQIVYIPGGGYYQVLDVVHEVGETEAVSLKNLYAHDDVLHPGQLAEDSFFPNQLLKIIPAAPVGETGAKGDIGATGPGATVLVDDVTLEAYTESNVDKIRAKAGGIDRSKLKETGTDGANELGIVRVDGGLEFSNDAGASGGLAVKVSGADSALEVTANGLRVADEAITLEKLEDDARTGRAFYGVEDNSSAANAYVVTLSNPPASLQAGMVLNFVTGAAKRNTSDTVSLQISGVGVAKTVKRRGAALVAGDIMSDSLVSVVYNGNYWELLSPPEGGDNRWRVLGPIAMPAAQAASTVAHNLSAVPQEVRAVLVCTTPDTNTGYAANDEISISGAYDNTNSTPAFSVFADSNNVGVSRSGVAAFRLLAKAGGYVNRDVSSAGNFQIKFYVRKYLAN